MWLRLLPTNQIKQGAVREPEKLQDDRKLGNECWPVNAKPNINPIDAACRHQLLHQRTLTATVVAPSVVYHCHVFVAFHGHHYSAMTDAHREYLLVLRLTRFLVSQKAHHYFEDNLKVSSM